MANKKKDTTEILAKIKEFVGEGGNVAFEHGFRYPTFKMLGYKYKCTMVSDKVMYGYKYYPTGERRTCNLPIHLLNYTALNTLYETMQKYLEYCTKDA